MLVKEYSNPTDPSNRCNLMSKCKKYVLNQLSILVLSTSYHWLYLSFNSAHEFNHLSLAAIFSREAQLRAGPIDCCFCWHHMLTSSYSSCETLPSGQHVFRYNWAHVREDLQPKHSLPSLEAAAAWKLLHGVDPDKCSSPFRFFCCWVRFLPN